MSKVWINEIRNGLETALKEQFNLGGDELKSVSATGQNSLMDGLKQFVMKNGSKEIESILLKQKAFEGSDLEKSIGARLSTDIKSKHQMPDDKAKSVSNFASNFLVEHIVSAFQASSESKDLDGICSFIGIDKNLLKMVNSPVGKMFGKFF
jgi:hypothetical protein